MQDLYISQAAALPICMVYPVMQRTSLANKTRMLATLQYGGAENKGLGNLDILL